MKSSPSLLVTSLLLCVRVIAATGIEGVKPSNDLMPAPAAIRFQVGRLPITKGFAIAASKYSDDRLQRAIDRTTHRLGARTGIDFTRPMATADHSALVIEVQRSGDLVQSLNEVESYTLQVTSQQALLKAETVVGALRGLETLLQLVSADPDGYFLPSVSIEDQPRFRWRGLLIDACRHWQPVEVIKRNLDGLAAVKMNVLHWHLTDDQGFRIESKKYAKLAEMGSAGDYYTQDQVREIVAYARDRGIRIIPEFDMPGHTTAWLAGYPELASAPGPYGPEHTFGVFDPTLDPTNEKTYKFLDGFLAEMATLFPDACVHVGGDENNGKQWKANRRIQSFMKAHNLKDESSLQAYFNQRVQKILERHGKKMVIWEEPMQSPQGVALESWHSGATLHEAVQHGHEALLSAPYYLDQIEPATDLYKADPLPLDSGLTPEQMKLVLGGEACMWTEHVSPETIDSRIWPLLAAIAERFWSPRETNDVVDMYRRLDLMSVRLEEFGLKHISHTNAMLRFGAEAVEIGTLQEFIQTVQPATFDQRESDQRPTQFTPLTHVIDVANPDPPYGRTFSSWVGALLSDVPRFVAHRADLEETFQRWRDLPQSFDAIAQTSPLLAEARPRINELAKFGEIGSEALTFLESGAAPPPGWKEAKMTVVDEATAPKAILRFVVLSPIRELIIAAAEASSSRSSNAADWRARVGAEAAASSSKSESYR